MDRFDRAHDDLVRWRRSRDELATSRSGDSAFESAARAVDSAFKAEVLEFRIRRVLNAHVLNEVELEHVDPQKTPTGQHMWDFDWWLTESTMRKLHGGVDALAQLLNVVLGCGVGVDDPKHAKEVADAVCSSIGADSDLCVAIRNLLGASEFRDLAAFVNHVKHQGFPERRAAGFPSADDRATTIGRFCQAKAVFGEWSPRDIAVIIDGTRCHLLHMVEAAVAVAPVPPQTA
ncbi:MAG: hypothetical protein WC971_03740 [Coriobacteriia bacterium]